MTPVKSGYRTSEFWTTVLTAVLSLVATIATANGWAFDTTKLTELVPVAATIMAGLVAAVYSHGRTTVKVAAIQATPTGPSATTTTSSVTYTLAPSNTGGHVVAGAGDGAGDVVGDQGSPVAGAPAAAPVPAAVPPTAAPVAPVDPPEAPVGDDVPPLIGD